jgi:hypothetical protein
MLTSISWQQYFVCILIATLLYYIFVWIVFYKAKIPSLIANTRSFSHYGEDHPDEVLTTAQHIIDEIRPIFKGRRNSNELLIVLQQQLKKYNQWEEPGFRDTINNFIASQSESICSIHLSERDLREVWNG